MRQTSEVPSHHEHPFGAYCRRKLREAASVFAIKRVLQAPTALVDHMDHDVLEELFLNEVPVDLDCPFLVSSPGLQHNRSSL